MNVEINLTGEHLGVAIGAAICGAIAIYAFRGSDPGDGYLAQWLAENRDKADSPQVQLATAMSDHGIMLDELPSSDGDGETEMADAK